ncbi:FAD-binding oxidoreductase [Amycolatopsis sp. cmx-4-61]|uniref:FAD-binding oxidoreductase n=1 Tax=Amycolatopsis sp. cmx-4-61 TaxID=2790937 RepID=UPI00397831AE
MDSEHDQGRPGVPRRAFLRIAGVSAAGAVAAACGPEKPAAPVASTAPATTASAPPASRLPTAPPNWDDLRTQLTGGLLRPGSDGYDTAKRGFNPLFDGNNPVAVATASSVQDVQTCLRTAAGRVTIAARSGGHSYAGYSVPGGGLVIDVAGLNKIDVQGGKAVIGAGAKLKDVYAALAQAGRVLPAGSCPTVGIAGLTLGGGIGVLARKYGLTCDHLSSAQVVVADGRALTASAGSEPDLFWALRGGGGGNFGVVTEFTFDTDPAPEELTVFSLRFPAGSASSVLAAWQQWIAAMPPELWANLVLSGGSPVQCRVGGCYVGGTAGLNTLLNNLTTNAGARPAQRTVKTLDYLGAMKYFEGSSNRQSFVASSRMITTPVDAAKVVAVADGKQGMDLLIDGLGGAVASPAKDATAFWHRDALASVQIYAPATAKTRAKVTQAVGDVVTGLAAAGAGGGYVNYIDPALPDWKTAYYGDNAKRLQDVSQKYDPQNVFRFGQGVVS